MNPIVSRFRHTLCGLSVATLLLGSSARAQEDDDLDTLEDSAEEPVAPQSESSEDIELEEAERGPLVVQRSSWDALFGGIPRGALVQGELGFTGIPRAAYHMALSPQLSVGGMVSLDYGYYQTRGTNFGVLFQAPIRFQLHQEGPFTVSVRGEPGFGFQFRGSTRFLLILAGSIQGGYAINNQITVGGGMEVPLMINIGDGPNFVVFPLLFGPMAEYHLTPSLALTADLKLGPWVVAGGGSVNSSTFGLKILMGAAYRF